jgi:hypothetical protein
VAHGGDAENKDAPQRLVWSSWLGEMPGLRKVRVANGKEALRLGLPDGQFILVDEKKLSRSDWNEIAFVRWWAKSFPGAYDKGLLRVLEKVLEDEKVRRVEFCEDVRDWAEKHEDKLNCAKVGKVLLKDEYGKTGPEIIEKEYQLLSVMENFERRFEYKSIVKAFETTMNKKNNRLILSGLESRHKNNISYEPNKSYLTKFRSNPQSKYRNSSEIIFYKDINN